MAPRKKRKSVGKALSVKPSSRGVLKKKKEGITKDKCENDNIEEISTKQDPLTNLSAKETRKSGKKGKRKSMITETPPCPVHGNVDVVTVGDENILNADFIPVSSTFQSPYVRRISDSFVSSSTSENTDGSVTITVDDDDDDDESVHINETGISEVSVNLNEKDSNSFSESIQIVEETVPQSDINYVMSKNVRNSVNESIEIVEEMISGNDISCIRSRNIRDINSTAARKRKFDDSIEILESDSESTHSAKKMRKIAGVESSAASSTVTSSSDGQQPDDDIVIIDTVDTNSRDSVKIMNDCVPIEVTRAFRKEKNKRKKMMLRKINFQGNNEQREEGNANNSHSLFFQDKYGNANGNSVRYKSPLSSIANKDSSTNNAYHNVYGNNMYNPNSVEKTGLRPVVIDGSNVAFGHGGKTFSVRGIEICVNYFVKRGHWVVAFVPLFRRSEVSEADRRILDDLKDKQQLVFTPSRFLHHRRIASYDDRFIVQCAAQLGGIVVSTDNYRDLVGENEAWRETIERRLLMFTWVGDLLMFPDDPNGRGGPRLEEFLRFPQ